MQTTKVSGMSVMSINGLWVNVRHAVASAGRALRKERSVWTRERPDAVEECLTIEFPVNTDMRASGEVFHQ